MLQEALSLSFPIFVFLFISLLRTAATANSNIYVKCSQQYFTPSTAYESNLNSLFTSLVESASVSNFNKFEMPASTSEAGDIVYGLFQCRGDLNSSNCRDCVTSSVSQLKAGCPMSTSGTIQLEACFVKYDNTPFFGAENKMEVANKCGPSIGDDSDLQKRIDDALAYLTSGFNGQYFRGGSFGSIQGVAQCVQDLSVSDCQDCLSEACAQLRSECGTSSSWGNIYLGTCYIQYADIDNVASDDNNGGGGGDGGRGRKHAKHKGRWIKGKIIGQVIGYVLNFLFTFGLSFLNYRHTNEKNKETVDRAYTRIRSVKSDLEEDIKVARDDVGKKVATVKKEVDILQQTNYSCSRRCC